VDRPLHLWHVAETYLMWRVEVMVRLGEALGNRQSSKSLLDYLLCCAAAGRRRRNPVHRGAVRACIVAELGPGTCCFISECSGGGLGEIEIWIVFSAG